MTDGYFDPLDALATSMGLDINNLPGQQKAQSKLNFKTHVDLTEIYGEFYIDLAEVLAVIVGQSLVSAALDDFSTIGPTIFGDMVMAIFDPTSGKKPGYDGEPVKGGTLMRLRQYFPTDIQNEGGLAQKLLEKTATAISQTISRSERAADHRLRQQYGYTVDIIHSYHPKPFLNLTGDTAVVTIYGEVWDKSAAREEELSDEDDDDDDEDNDTPFPPFNPHISYEESMKILYPQLDTSALDALLPPSRLTEVTKAIIKVNDQQPDCFNILDSAPTRF